MSNAVSCSAAIVFYMHALVAAMPNAAASCSSFCSCFLAATFDSHNTATCSFKLRPATMFTFNIQLGAEAVSKRTEPGVICFKPS
jgi:hypothetical protein